MYRNFRNSSIILFIISVGMFRGFDLFFFNKNRNKLNWTEFLCLSMVSLFVCAGVLSLGVPGVPPPDLGRSDNPISTRWADYAHHITIWHPGLDNFDTSPVRYITGGLSTLQHQETPRKPPGFFSGENRKFQSFRLLF